MADPVGLSALAATWIADTLIGELNFRNMGLDKVEPAIFSDLLILLKKSQITDKHAVQMLRINLDHLMKGEPVEKWNDLIEKHGFVKIIYQKNLGTNTQVVTNTKAMPLEYQIKNPILDAIKETINEQLKAVEDYKNGKKGAFNFLIGQIMKKTKGGADPAELNRLLTEELQKGA